MINWRDVRSREALSEFIAEFNALPEAAQSVILEEQKELLDRQADKDSLRAVAPHKQPVAPRGKRKRRIRR